MIQPYTFGTFSELEAAGRIFNYVFEVYRDCKLYKVGTEGRPVKRLRFSGELAGGHLEAYNSVAKKIVLRRIEVELDALSLSSNDTDSVSSSESSI